MIFAPPSVFLSRCLELVVLLHSFHRSTDFLFQDGFSALMIASEHVHTDIVKHLILAKASVDLQAQVVLNII